METKTEATPDAELKAKRNTRAGTTPKQPASMTNAGVITDEAVAAVAAYIQAAEAILHQFALPLSAIERRTLPKMRPGGDKVVGVVVGAARQAGVQLPGVTVDGIEAALSAARRAGPLRVASQQLAAALTGLVARYEATAWGGATLHYSVLARIARGNPRLGAGLRTATEFFTHRSVAATQARAEERATRKVTQATRQAAKAVIRAAAIKLRIAENAALDAAGTTSLTTGASSNGAPMNRTPTHGVSS